jgi:hypothetical protein
MYEIAVTQVVTVLCGQTRAKLAEMFPVQILTTAAEAWSARVVVHVHHDRLPKGQGDSLRAELGSGGGFVAKLVRK